LKIYKESLKNQIEKDFYLQTKNMKLDPKSIQESIVQLVEVYKLDPYNVLEIIKLWIKSGFKKDFPQYKKSNIVINIEEDGTISIYKEIEIVTDEDLENTETQMTIEEAKKISKDVKTKEKLLINVTPEVLELSRIAAQAAAQTIKQNLKNIERENFFEKFQNKQGELLKAQVIRAHGDSVVLEAEWTAVVLQPEGQIPHRIYEPNEEIFVLLKQISKWQWWIVLDITQSSEEYIEAILRKLVPELEEWIVTIEKMARIPGKKTKIVVSSSEENIDPVGVMVGRKWDRINTVLSLLEGEKIDYIENTEDETELIKNCLKPAKINWIEIKDRRALVYMDESQKPLAIWKAAANVKLASRISGYNIEIQ